MDSKTSFLANKLTHHSGHFLFGIRILRIVAALPSLVGTVVRSFDVRFVPNACQIAPSGRSFRVPVDKLPGNSRRAGVDVAF